MYKTFIIHLSKIPSSLESATKLQKDLLDIDIQAKLFEGTYGSDAEKIFEKEKRQVHPISFKGVGIDERYENKTRRPGVMGCFYSHYRLWKRALKLNEPICIFEDDVTIHRKLVPVEFEDILIVSLGAKKSDRYKHFLNNPTGEPRAEDYQNASMPGTTGYIITPAGAKKLLNAYRKTFLASDNAINKMIVDIKIHSHLVGEANLEKKSLTRAISFWKEFDEK